VNSQSRRNPQQENEGGQQKNGKGLKGKDDWSTQHWGNVGGQGEFHILYDRQNWGERENEIMAMMGKHERKKNPENRLSRRGGTNRIGGGKTKTLRIERL